MLLLILLLLQTISTVTQPSVREAFAQVLGRSALLLPPDVLVRNGAGELLVNCQHGAPLSLHGYDSWHSRPPSPSSCPCVAPAARSLRSRCTVRCIDGTSCRMCLRESRLTGLHGLPSLRRLPLSHWRYSIAVITPADPIAHNFDCSPFNQRPIAPRHRLPTGR